MITPLTKQYFRLEVIGLNLTDITWPENISFSIPLKLFFFAEFISASSSILFRIILARYSLPVIQFFLMLLGQGICILTMLTLS